MSTRRVAALLTAAGLALGACGGSSDDPVAQDTIAELPPVSTTESIQPPSSDSSEPPTTESPDDGAPGDEAAEPLPSSPQSTTPAATPATDAAAPPSTETAPPATEAAPPATETAPDETAPPDDGCSTDGAPTPLEVADGPAPALAVDAGAADSPFPDLSVRRVNCAGGWVQLKNELPADLPVLAWVWAPH